VRSSLTLGLTACDRDLPSPRFLFGQFRTATATLQYQEGPGRVMLDIWCFTGRWLAEIGALGMRDARLRAGAERSEGEVRVK
jgi:hypothetical protein